MQPHPKVELGPKASINFVISQDSLALLSQRRWHRRNASESEWGAEAEGRIDDITGQPGRSPVMLFSCLPDLPTWPTWLFSQLWHNLFQSVQCRTIFLYKCHLCWISSFVVVVVLLLLSVVIVLLLLFSCFVLLLLFLLLSLFCCLLFLLLFLHTDLSSWHTWPSYLTKKTFSLIQTLTRAVSQFLPCLNNYYLVPRRSGSSQI